MLISLQSSTAEGQIEYIEIKGLAGGKKGRATDVTVLVGLGSKRRQGVFQTEQLPQRCRLHVGIGHAESYVKERFENPQEHFFGNHQQWFVRSAGSRL
jgi:hypothetical protein